MLPIEAYKEFMKSFEFINPARDIAPDIAEILIHNHENPPGDKEKKSI